MLKTYTYECIEGIYDHEPLYRIEHHATAVVGFDLKIKLTYVMTDDQMQIERNHIDVCILHQDIPGQGHNFSYYQLDRVVDAFIARIRQNIHKEG
jgi:hypothetical protein